MSESLARLKNRITFLKKQNPAYEEILGFYEKIREAQEANNNILKIPPVDTHDNFKNVKIKEGFPLINKEDFVLDISASVALFEALCRIGKNATNKMKDNIILIDDAVRNNMLDRETLLEKYHDKRYLDGILKDLEVDEAILEFLIHASIKPSIEANVEKLKGEMDLSAWLRGYCPVCGSFPDMSELKGEGQRFFKCSFCGVEWPSERLKCPFCENREHESLHYFYEEGKELYRVDVCDKCRQYIKTVDSRKLDCEPDLDLEDIATVHLDIMAAAQGFTRPTPTPWAEKGVPGK